MGYALLWVEVLAAAVLLAALGMTSVARRKGRPWRVASAAGMLLACLSPGLVMGFGAYLFTYIYLLLCPWLAYAASWTAVAAAACSLVLWRGLRTGADGRPAALGWPRGRLALSTAGAVVLAVMTFWNLDLAALHQLATLRTEAGAMALAAAPARVPDRENAALVYAQAFESLRGVPKPTDEQSDARDAWVRDPAQMKQHLGDAALRQTLAAAGPGLDLVRQAAALPDCTFERNYGHPGFDMLLPELAELRSAARLLELDAAVRAAEGKPREALADVTALLGMASHAGQEPLIMSSLVGFSIHAVGVRSLETALGTTRPTSDDLAQASLDSAGPHQRGMARAMQMEEAFGLSAFAMLGDDAGGNLRAAIGMARVAQPLVAVWRVFLMPSDVASYRRVMEQYRMLAAKPFYETHAEWEDWARDKWVREIGMLTRQIAPALSRCAQTAATADARHQAARLGLAAAAYRLKHGRPPAQPADLVPEFLPAVPLDPFDGKPMKMVTSSNEVIFYSIGDDLKDDGGTPWDDKTRAGDVTFRVGG